MKCFRWRCYVNNSFLVFHQGTKHSKTIKHSRFAFVFHTVFSCLDPLMKHSNSLFTYNVNIAYRRSYFVLFNGHSNMLKAKLCLPFPFYVQKRSKFTLLQFFLELHSVRSITTFSLLSYIFAFLHGIKIVISSFLRRSERINSWTTPVSHLHKRPSRINNLTRCLTFPCLPTTQNASQLLNHRLMPVSFKLKRETWRNGLSFGGSNSTPKNAKF